MEKKFLSQGHAEDVLQWHRFNYYCRGVSLVSDQEYDALERRIRALWSIGIASLTVGSDDPADYPRYIREGRRPNAEERRLRDKAIVARWMENL